MQSEKEEVQRGKKIGAGRRRKGAVREGIGVAREGRGAVRVRKGIAREGRGAKRGRKRCCY